MFDLRNRTDFVVGAVLFESSLIGVAGALGWWFGVDPFASLRCEGLAVVEGLAATVPIFGLFLLANRFPVGPLRKIKQFLIEALGPALTACRWYDLLLVAAAAGAGEELLFRGVLHPLAGLGWSNVLFGLVHFITPAYALMAGLLGTYLGWLLESSENILAPIVTHGFYDYLAFLVVARECRSSPPSQLTDP